MTHKDIAEQAKKDFNRVSFASVNDLVDALITYFQTAYTPLIEEARREEQDRIYGSLMVSRERAMNPGSDPISDDYYVNWEDVERAFESTTNPIEEAVKAERERILKWSISELKHIEAQIPDEVDLEVSEYLVGQRNKLTDLQEFITNPKSQ